MLPILAILVAAAPSPEALAILQRHECHRCHEVEGLAPLPLTRSCAGCHRDIASATDDPAREARGRAEYGAVWERFVRRTSGAYCHIPALSGMGRFRASWLRDFLRAPYDLRPNLGESMIRHDLTDEEIDTLVRGWGASPEEPAPAAPPPERLARGERLFQERSCGACHLFGNRPFEVAAGFQFDFLPRVRARALAPDLRHARDRLTRAWVMAWIRDPQAVKPGAEMPGAELPEADVSALADFILFGEPGHPAPIAPRRPPKLDLGKGVPRYEEVETRVFKAICWHCHSEPDFADGDGGPGNSGGFGFRRTGLSFASYEGILNGSVGPDSRRRSIFRPGETGEPVLLERLRLRYQENDRDFVLPGHDDLADRRAPRSHAPRGMPLGLPALTDEQFSLVERWVRGGHPGPTGAPAQSQPGPMGR